MITTRKMPRTESKEPKMWRVPVTVHMRIRTTALMEAATAKEAEELVAKCGEGQFAEDLDVNLDDLNDSDITEVETRADKKHPVVLA